MRYKWLSFLLLIPFSMHSQVKIGDNPSSINPSSVLEIESTNKGILIPRVDLVNSPPTNPAKALLVWNTNSSFGSEGFYFYNGTNWQLISNTNTTWQKQGNSGTNPASDFLGTTDNARLTLKTNNITRLSIGDDQTTSFTNLNASNNLNRIYGNGNIIGFNSILDANSGLQSGNLLGLENLLYLRTGSALNATTGTLRGLRNRLWNVQTANYPFVQGVYNEYRGEVTDITDYRGFTNNIDLRSASNISNFYGFTTEFNQVNGTISNYYGFSNFPRQSNLSNYTNYFGYFQANLGNSASRYAFFYDATESNTNKVVINGQGRIGIGTISPSAAVEINATNPLRLTQVSSGATSDEVLTINTNGDVRKLGMPSNNFINIAMLNLPSGNGVIRHNYDIGLTGVNINAQIFKIVGTTQQFTITGISGGTNGRVVKIFNTAINGNMILTNEDVNSLPQNRIISLNGGNVNTNGSGIISLYYDGGLQRWVILNIQE